MYVGIDIENSESSVESVDIKDANVTELAKICQLGENYTIQLNESLD